MDKQYAIQLENVSFNYEKEPAVQNVSLNIPKGTLLGLVGANGSGKSTLIKLILGLIKPTTGSIKLFGTPIQNFTAWDKIGFVSQKANSFNSGFPATVHEVVTMGLVSKVGLFRFFSKKHKEKAKQAIEMVGLSEFINRNIGELSGGQQQRAFIARALVSDPELLILDEPTVGVDTKNVESFYQLLADLNKQGITMLMVTHDIGTITKHATHVACMNKTLHYHGKSEEFHALSDEDLSSIYGHPVQSIVHNH